MLEERVRQVRILRSRLEKSDPLEAQLGALEEGLLALRPDASDAETRLEVLERESRRLLDQLVKTHDSTPRLRELRSGLEEAGMSRSEVIEWLMTYHRPYVSYPDGAPNPLGAAILELVPENLAEVLALARRKKWQQTLAELLFHYDPELAYQLVTEPANPFPARAAKHLVRLDAARYADILRAGLGAATVQRQEQEQLLATLLEVQPSGWLESCIQHHRAFPQALTALLLYDADRFWPLVEEMARSSDQYERGQALRVAADVLPERLGPLAATRLGTREYDGEVATAVLLERAGEVAPHVAPLLEAKSGDVRLAAVQVLAAVDACRPLLEKRAAVEKVAKVKNALLKALAGGAFDGSREALEREITQHAAQSPDWFSPRSSLVWQGGDVARPELGHHLLSLQARGICPRSRVALLDRAACAPWAAELLTAWSTALREPAALGLVGLLGAPELAPFLTALVKQLLAANRGAYAAHAAAALAQIDLAAAQGLRVRHKQVKRLVRETLARLAEAEGVSQAELVQRSIRKEAQAARYLEQAMVEDESWERAVWWARFQGQAPWTEVARRLIWLQGDRSFRPLDDGTLTDAADHSLELGEGPIRLAHPLDGLSVWERHFADYEVVQPFPQVGRPYALPPFEVEGRKLPAPALTAWMRSHDWRHGEVEDNGITSEMVRVFESAEAVLEHSGLPVAGPCDWDVELLGFRITPEPPPERILSEVLVDLSRLQR